MKKNLFRLLPIIIAIVLNSFSNKRTITVYFVYDGFGSHDLMWNYTMTGFSPGYQFGTDRLAWISLEDDNGTVTYGEFWNAFESLDWVNDWDNSLDDDVEGRVGDYELEKKF
jgi:hypothetical protein